jgi:hypothetical protein
LPHGVAIAVERFDPVQGVGDVPGVDVRNAHGLPGNFCACRWWLGARAGCEPGSLALAVRAGGRVMLCVGGELLTQARIGHASQQPVPLLGGEDPRFHDRAHNSLVRVDDRGLDDCRWQVAAEQKAHDAGVEEPQQDVPWGGTVEAEPFQPRPA